MGASAARQRVLYICGWGRSGTTIVDRVLGQLPGFVSVGELRSLWDADPHEQVCGCGETVASCPLWRAVLGELLDGSGRYTLRTVRSMRDEVARTRDLPTLWWQARHPDRPRTESFVPSYGDVLVATYRAVLTTTGSGMVVDSSKHPAEALLLAARPDVDLTVIHLVRDPRAVAYSWSSRSPARRGVQPAPGDPPERGVSSSAAWWTAWNAAIEGLLRPRLGHRFVSLRYEDVMAAPRREFAKVAQRLSASVGDLEFTGDDEIVLRPSHAVAGNPNRHRVGPVRLAPDVEWLFQMRSRDRCIATLGAFPLLGHYGYRWRSSLRAVTG